MAFCVSMLCTKGTTRKSSSVILKAAARAYVSSLRRTEGGISATPWHAAAVLLSMAIRSPPYTSVSSLHMTLVGFLDFLLVVFSVVHARPHTLTIPPLPCGMRLHTRFTPTRTPTDCLNACSARSLAIGAHDAWRPKP